MRILQVISSSRTSGAERHVVVLSERLRRLGHSVTAVCPQGGWLPDQLKAAGVPTIEIPMHGVRAPRAAVSLARIARSEGCDLIHSHLTRATYLGYMAAGLAHVPLVSTMHVLTKDWAYRHLPRRSHWFVAVSDSLRQTLVGRGVPENHVTTVYNGTEICADDLITDGSDLSVRAELGVPAEAELVGEFARIDAFKGQHLLVDATPAIVAARPRAYVVLVGKAEPSVQQCLWERASRLGVADRIRFTGVRDDVPRLLEAMDVVTLPSISEACSMAIIEAMAMGKPVVATRAGGNPELVEEGLTGRLVPREADAVGQAIISILDDAGIRHRMGETAKSRARERFSAAAMAENMVRVYEQILASRSAATS